MIKKPITYDTYDGETITEDFYFNLSKAELAEIEITTPGGFKDYLDKIIKSQDGKIIMETFKLILTMSIGRKSEDGKRFMKNDDIRNEFMQSEAYSNLFLEICTDAAKAAEFVEGIMPAGILDGIEIPKAENVDLPEDKKPAWFAENRDPTHEELMNMSKEEMQLAFKMKEIRAQEKLDNA